MTTETIINCNRCEVALAIVAAGRARLIADASTQGATLIATGGGCYIIICYACPAATPYTPEDATWGDRAATISRAAHISAARERADAAKLTNHQPSTKDRSN